MLNGLIESAVKDGPPPEPKVYGVAVATVVCNIDSLGEGRVQVSYSWFPGPKPWARVATPMAGMGRGFFFMPQVGEEVLCSFNHGDIRCPFIVGGLWNSLDRPPAMLPTDAVNKRIIRTPLGHKIAFDEVTQEVEIATSTFQKVKLGPDAVEMKTTGNTASIRLGVTGDVTITGATSIALKAPSISIQGATVEVTGATSTSITGGANCELKGGLVRIN
jgi:phage baseplate assembly protein gpV